MLDKVLDLLPLRDVPRLWRGKLSAEHLKQPVALRTGASLRASGVLERLAAGEAYKRKPELLSSLRLREVRVVLELSHAHMPSNE